MKTNDNSHSYNKAIFIQEPARIEDIHFYMQLFYLNPHILMVKIYFVQYNCLYLFFDQDYVHHSLKNSSHNTFVSWGVRVIPHTS